MLSQKKVLAIILNWQQADATIKCVQALKSIAFPSLNILVVDNGSRDSSTEIIQRKLPEIEIISLPTNTGFAAGNNVGLRRALERDYQYALVLNSDAFVSNQMLDNLLKESEPDIALLAPKIFYAKRPDTIWFAGGMRAPRTLDLVHTGRGMKDGPEWADSRDVDYLLGTCLLVNLAAATKVGLFDETFFLYFEDLDWSIRFSRAGFRLRFVSDAHCFHGVATSSGGEDSPWRRYHMARSSVIFWRKYAHLGNPLIIVFFRMGSAIKMIARLMLSGRWGVTRAYVSGLFAGWKTHLRD